MICDVVGSTALSARLDPEDMRVVIDACHAACYHGVLAQGTLAAEVTDHHHPCRDANNDGTIDAKELKGAAGHSLSTPEAPLDRFQADLN
jgi:hypothetical protein